MKKLSDYKGDEAIELWVDLLDPLTVILSDPDIKKVVQSGKPKMEIAKAILKSHSDQAVEILTRIDPTPVDGLNLILRLVALITDIGQNEDIKGFFGYAETQTGEESSGSATESIKAVKK